MVLVMIWENGVQKEGMNRQYTHPAINRQLDMEKNNKVSVIELYEQVNLQ